MARYRKLTFAQHKHEKKDETSSNSDKSESPPFLIRILMVFSVGKILVGVSCLLIAAYVSILGYLETRVNTPFSNEKVVRKSGLDVPDRYWGTYRPGVYFGMKSREPYSPVFGLMWYDLAASSHKGIRHWCEQGDNLPSYGWQRHDGVTFGEQVIEDPPHTLITSFVKTPSAQHGGHWTARINVTAKNNARTPFMLVWYGALDESSGAPRLRLWAEGGGLLGHTPQLDNYRLTLVPHQGKIIQMSYSEAYAPGLHLLKEKFLSLLKVQRHSTYGRVAMLGPDMELDKDRNVNFVPIQLLVETPFVLDVVYTAEGLPEPTLQGEEYTQVLQEKREDFDEMFLEKFPLLKKEYREEDVAVARAAMSNMIGGIGYFYGASRVQSYYTKEPVPYWKAPLYTAVPSRSFFPRGFLWDEGFHGLLIGRWSPEIQMDISAHWLDLINVEGWIPREQILGVEALARVPKEFIVQSNAAANPPMLLIQLARMLQLNPGLFLPDMPLRKTLERMYDRLKAWYNWFQTTQRGEEATSYRWRGREDDGMQLNPKTLTSGLDDYPRASHPSNIERHVDLRCWMYAASDSMATIARTIDRDYEKYEAIRDELGDEDILNDLHWSPQTQTYADYGLHTDGVKLVRTHPKHPNENPRMVRSVSVAPQPKLVTSAFGYVSLFPMLLKVLSPESDKLGKILEDLDKPGLLWSPYGLRSLSKTSPLFMKRNTEHDPPYWRGQVWASINYLCVSALRHYAVAPGPHAARARLLHDRLRGNLVRNILSEYKRTGYLWEQYSAEDGKGSGCRPFTGWTALITLIMAEEY